MKIHLLTQIPSRKRKCDMTNKAFSPLETIYSVLIEENNQVTRQDYCENGWKQALKDTPNLSKAPNWTSQKALPQQKGTNPGYPPEQIEELLDKAHHNLISDESDANYRALFILGFLIKKKLILPLPQIIHKKIKCSVYNYDDKEYIFPTSMLNKIPPASIIPSLEKDFSLTTPQPS